MASRVSEDANGDRTQRSRRFEGLLLSDSASGNCRLEEMIGVNKNPAKGGRGNQETLMTLPDASAIQQFSCYRGSGDSSVEYYRNGGGRLAE